MDTSQDMLPVLPSEVCGMIARTALVEEGCSVQAWARLSLVDPSCRHAMSDIPVDVRFKPATGSEQRAWLTATRQPLRSLKLQPGDAAVGNLLTQDGPTLLRSHETLQEMHDLEVPPAASLAALAQPPSLSRFRCLERLTLCSFKQTVIGLPQLPVSLRHLVLDGYDGVGPDCEPPYKLRLGGLTRLETLSLLGCAVNALEDEYTHLGAYSYWTSEPEAAPLPPSLRTLRLEAPTSAMTIDLSRHTLSAASELTLGTSVGVVACDVGFRSGSEWAEPACTLLYLSTELPEDVRSSEATSLLPDGVRTLSMEANVISIACAHMPATLEPELVCEADAVKALCELFSLAPQSYREYRLRRGPEPGLAISLLWNDAADLDFPHHKSFRFESIMSLADALQSVAHEYALNVSICDHQSCCVVSRGAEVDGVMETT